MTKFEFTVPGSISLNRIEVMSVSSYFWTEVLLTLRYYIEFLFLEI